MSTIEEERYENLRAINAYKKGNCKRFTKKMVTLFTRQYLLLFNVVVLEWSVRTI